MTSTPTTPIPPEASVSHGTEGTDIPQGFINFRAVRPMTTSGGGRLRPNHLFRSGSFERIGPEGLAHLRSMGIARVFDLRAAAEITSHPAPFPASEGLAVTAPGHSVRLGDLTTVLGNEAMRAADVGEAMIAVYRDLARHFPPIFAAAIRFAAAPGALVVNCTAGKDRTGATVALILSALGVHRDDILSDYLETNAARDVLVAMLTTRRGGIDYGRLSPDRLAPLHAADAAYLEAFFATIDAEFGGVDTYLVQALQLDDALRQQLQAALLETS